MVWSMRFHKSSTRNSIDDSEVARYATWSNGPDTKELTKKLLGSVLSISLTWPSTLKIFTSPIPTNPVQYPNSDPLMKRTLHVNNYQTTSTKKSNGSSSHSRVSHFNFKSSELSIIIYNHLCIIYNLRYITFRLPLSLPALLRYRSRYVGQQLGLYF